MMTSINRRTFMIGSMAAGMSLGFSRWSWGQITGANDDIRVAVVGLRKQGKRHVQWFREIPGIRVVALCDPDQSVLDREEDKFHKRNEKVDTYADYRKLLEDKNIDAVVIAAPNHWHALATVWGCQAGKDVYVEKPISHSIWEGRQMVKAARKYNRIVQAGLQRRSDKGLKEALDYIKQGNLGKIQYIRGVCFVRRGSIGKVTGPQPIPASVDYDLWCGPSDKMPLMRQNLHYDWHWDWSTGDGEFGNNGIHFVDVCRWALQENKLPPRVLSLGGRFGYIDDGQTPNTHLILLDYQPAPIIFELRGLPVKTGTTAMDSYRGIRTGVVIQCEGGYFCGGFAYDNNGKKLKQFERDGGGAHKANFIEAVRSRKNSDLNADVLEGHLSTALCHLGNISFRIGKLAQQEEIMDAIKANKEVVDSCERMLANLRANDIDLKQTPITLGTCLTVDSQKERFVGDFSDWGNMLLNLNYREPFVVPEKV